MRQHSGRTASRAFLLQTVTVGLGLLLAWGFLEVAVLVVRGEQAKFPRRVVEAPWGLRYNDPGASYRHKSADGTFRFDINDQGMRANRNYEYAKPDGVKRIISLGDSYTIGYEVDVEQCFSSVLERELNETGRSVEVLNAGVSGFSNAEELAYLETELLRYDPDVVVVSFYSNDLVDNDRAALFALGDDGELVQLSRRYVPAGALGNFLNSSWFFNLLSERSNAFVFVKEALTEIVKSGMVRQNESSLAAARDGAREGSEELGADPDSAALSAGALRRKRLAAAIFEHMYQLLHEQGIPLVIHSIPSGIYAPEGDVVEAFPLDLFDVDRPGVSFVTIMPLAATYDGEEVLVNRRSHFHWARIPHEWAGKAIAGVILGEGVLD